MAKTARQILGKEILEGLKPSPRLIPNLANGKPNAKAIWR